MKRFTKLDAGGEILPVESAIFSSVLDELLGIEWHPQAIRVANWQEAQDKAAALGDGWRCPTIEELSALVDRSKREPAIDSQYFPNTPTDDWYWSSSPVVGWPEAAWNVYFNFGYVYHVPRDYSGFVRPVRAARARQCLDLGDTAQIESAASAAVETPIKLGHRYRDLVTGFAGVATGYVQYLTGCNQVLLAPGVGPDGAHRDSHWLDVQRLVAERGKPIVLNNVAAGFDKAAPKR